MPQPGFIVKTLCFMGSMLFCAGPAGSTETAALYHAGVAGNPASAPSPDAVALAWTVDLPTSDTGNFLSAPVSPDGGTGFNAWRIRDASVTSSQYLRWKRVLSTQQQSDAAARGWNLASRLRVADPMADNSGTNSVVMSYTTANNTRYNVFFDLNASGQLVTTLEANTSTADITIAHPDLDAGQYHEHELRCASNGKADYYVNGILKYSGYVGGGRSSGTAGSVQFGTRSTNGKGDGFWNAVEFIINDPPPVAPKVTTHPVSVAAGPGASVTLSATFSGTSLTYQWYRDTVAVAGATGNTLTLNNLNTASAGDYWLRATNTSGTAETQTAAVSLLDRTHLVISEFLAENDKNLIDRDGEQHDWLELHNPGTSPLSTAGLFLTDDPLAPARWALPAETIPPGGFLLVIASGKDRATAGAELHTNFRISNSGGYLALTDGAAPVSALTYPVQYSDISYGITARSPGTFKHFMTPTPGALNVDGITQVRPLPVFSIPGGVFSTSRSVEISTTLAGGTLRFTTDGSFPQFDSTAYTGAIPLTATTTLRAACLFPGDRYGASASTTHIKQGSGLAAFSSPLPIVVLHNHGAGAVPGVSARGPNGDGSDVVAVSSQLVSMTILDEAAGNTSFSSPAVHHSRAGLRLRGSSSFSFTRKSYALETWNERNDSPADLPLLGMSAENDWVLYAPDPGSGFDVPLIHNSLIYELARQSGFDAPRFRFVEVFLNTTGGDLTSSDQRGLYLLVEKPKRGSGRINFQRLNHDGTAGGWMLNIDRMDALPPGSALGSITPRHFHTAGPDGALTTPDDIARGLSTGLDMPNYYHSFFNFDSPGGWEITNAQRAPIQSFVRAFDTALYGANYTHPTLGYTPYIDVANWAQHLVFQSFAKNQDAIVLSAYLKRETPTSAMKWATIWDFDRSYNRNTTGGNAATSNLSWAHDRMYYKRLMTDVNFVQAYIDQWQHLRRGPFSTANLMAVVDSQVAAITADVAARSGTTASNWTTNVATLKTWLTDRAAAFDSQYTAPPVFSHSGGSVPAGFTLGVTAPAGTVYYTTDGSDPRAAGGGVAGTAYTSAIPITSPTTVTARAMLGSAWSGPTTQLYFPPQDLSALRVSEIHYNPPTWGGFDGDDFEFLELQNTGEATLELGGLSFIGIGYTFPASTSLGPGDCFVLVRNPTRFSSRFPSAPFHATYTGKLENAGEAISLVQSAATVFSLSYDDVPPWPTQADNGGMSLQRPFPTAPGYSAATWTAAAPTPGAALSLEDSDADGMPDYFEILHNLDDPASDDDGDGQDNLTEFRFGTEPRDAGSATRLSLATRIPGIVTLEFTALAGRSYQVQSSENLTDWTTIGTLPAHEQTRAISIDHPATGVRQFLRLATP